ncbi:CUB and sushi domain-containing protein 1-like [Mercenaria mercenaria]|uniref:CUB and sushi domain-containing protein 1-like n=1 Tax=Mercenaria mercenaria TaxID=6596 RepID=UPI00234E56BD|nr:CUB and sushi domain-containing protein 1-like [Mercenaria mercenaria]
MTTNIIFLIIYLWFIPWIAEVSSDTVKSVSKCEDKSPNCEKGYKNLCKNFTEFALVYCRKSCNFCKACEFPPPIPPNGKVTLSENNVFTAFYQCDLGYYRSSGDSELKCKEGLNPGNWTGKLPTCSPVLTVTCSNSNITESCTRVSHAKCAGDNNVCSCEPGFEISGSNTSCKEVHYKSCYTNSTCMTLERSLCHKTPTSTLAPLITMAPQETLVQGHCECETGFFYNQSSFSCTAVLAKVCSEVNVRKSCTEVDHAMCPEDSKECVCEPGFEISPDSTSCLEVHNKTCEDFGKKSPCKNLKHALCYEVEQPITKIFTTTLPSPAPSSPGRCECAAGFYYNQSSFSCMTGCQLPNTDITFTKFVEQNGNIALYHQQATVQYQCRDGYEFQSGTNTTKTLTCTDNGQFTTLEHCLEKDCGPVGEISNTETITLSPTKDTTFGSKAMVSCIHGYVVSGTENKQNQFSMSCSKNGTWQIREDCVRIDCGNVNINNADDIHLSPDNDTRLNAKATVTCKSGHVVSGENRNTSFEMQCTPNGTWSTVKDCVRIDCGNLSTLNLSNSVGSLSDSDTKYNSTANIKCDTGYYNKNANQTEGISTVDIRCDENGKWTNLPTCVLKDCGSLSLVDIRNAENRILNSGTKYNSTAKVSCDIGYYDQNKKQTEGTSTAEIKCGENGSWTNLPTCVRKDCHAVSNIGIDHAGNIRVHNDTKYNSTADIDCIEGYYNVKDTQTTGISTTTIICSEHGTWMNLTISTIFDADCGTLDQLNISNAKLRLTFTDTKYQSNAAITCDTGYTDKHKSQAVDTSTTLIKCSANGTWTHLPECVRKECGNVHNISIVNAANRRVHNDTKYQSTAEIYCDEGYYISKVTQTSGISTTTISCSEHGIWVDIPTCERKECGDLSQLNISNAKDRFTINDTKYNSMANISCDVGYKEQNKSQTKGITSTSIRCNENGTWGNQPTCVRKDCGDVYNVSISNADNRRLHTDTKYSSTAEIDCNEGYYNINDTQSTGISTTAITCSEYGTWINMPMCVRKAVLGKYDHSEFH